MSHHVPCVVCGFATTQELNPSIHGVLAVCEKCVNRGDVLFGEPENEGDKTNDDADPRSSREPDERSGDDGAPSAGASEEVTEAQGGQAEAQGHRETPLEAEWREAEGVDQEAEGEEDGEQETVEASEKDLAERAEARLEKGESFQPDQGSEGRQAGQRDGAGDEGRSELSRDERPHPPDAAREGGQKGRRKREGRQTRDEPERTGGDGDSTGRVVYEKHGVTLYLAEVTAALRTIPDCSFDALMCDPPYGFSFMNKLWDYAVPSVELWRECLRVLKPGAPLVAYGGSRTYHRLACGIEDAGFELRDCMMWLHAKGFPKSQNVGLAIDKAAGAVREVVGPVALPARNGDGTNAMGGGWQDTPMVTIAATPLAKEWDGYGTALKPAFEPIVLARKPLDGTMAENVARWGVGGLAIDACRIDWDGPEDAAAAAAVGYADSRSRGAIRPSNSIGKESRDGTNRYDPSSIKGRWPANLLLDEGAAEILDAEVGPRKSGLAVRENGGGGQIMSGIGDQPYRPKPSLPNLGYVDGDTRPSRFYFTSKVSSFERELGCEDLEMRSAGEVVGRSEDKAPGTLHGRAGAAHGGGARNHHPTLKPIHLNTWLARLILPSPSRSRRLLVPFAGSASEIIGARRAGWDEIVGIEGDAEYAEIAKARLDRWAQIPENVDPMESRPESVDHRQAKLFW
jgi:hypothetical protein